MDILFNLFFSLLGSHIKNFLLEFLNVIFEFIAFLSPGMWNSPLSQIVLKSITVICYSMWVLSIVFVVIDIVEDLQNNNPIPFVSVITNIAKGFIFATSAVSFVSIIFNLSTQISSAIPVKVQNSDWNSLTDIVNNVINGAFSSSAVTSVLLIVFVIITIVAGIIFVWYTLVVYTHCLLHSVTASFHIVSITRGNEAIMYDWIKTACYYTLGYVLQSLFFKYGMAFLLNGFAVITGESIMGVACFVCMFYVPRIISKTAPTGVNSILQGAVSVGNSASRLFGK